MTNMRNIRFKARAKKTKEWVEGYYAIIYAPRTGDEGEVIGVDEFPCIQVDNEQKHRYGGYWVDVYPQTLCQLSDMEDADRLPIWEHDTVLDNCMGSGTTAIACIKEKRHFIGFELNKEYYEKAVRRIRNEQRQLKLF